MSSFRAPDDCCRPRQAARRDPLRAAAALAGLLLLLAGFPSLAPVASEEPVPGDYPRLMECRFADTPVPIPPQGLTWTRDTAAWTLESGEVRLMEPASGGTVTGLVFQGRGRFTLDVPDLREAAQLRRYTGQEGGRLDVPFSSLVLRTSEEFLAALVGSPGAGPCSPNKTARERQDKWLQWARLDVNARVVSGRLIPGDEYLLAEMETEAFGWLLYEFDCRRMEEANLDRFRGTNDFVEVWVSLDRAEDRGPDGRPTGRRRDLIDLTHAELAANLKEHAGRESRDIAQGSEHGRDRPVTGLQATITFTPLVEGMMAVPLILDPYARVFAVADADGRPLPFIRDAIGERFRMVDSLVYDGDLTVLLPEPLHQGAEVRLTVTYGLRTGNAMLGRDWYPATEEGHNDLHTARITVVHPPRLQIRAVGECEGEEERGDQRVSVWKMERPTRAAAFSYGKAYKEEKLELEGLPEILSFGTEEGLTLGSVNRNVAADVANSLNFYQQYFGCRLSVDRILAARVADFSQAYEGFLNYSVLAYNGEYPGLAELLRARQVAYLFWAHQVGWEGYRDQWLASALAEYLAILFLDSALPGKGFFEEVLEVYGNELLSSQKLAMSTFSTGLDLPDSFSYGIFTGGGYWREFELLLLPHYLEYSRWSQQDMDKLGPIGLGYRASSAEVPYAHTVYNLRKGVLVLHMLRGMLRNDPAHKGEDLFRATLGQFLRDYSGKTASTRDFVRTLEQVSHANWDWFFNQWVAGTGVPTLACSYHQGEAAGAGGEYTLTLEVCKTGVPAGFRLLLPVTLDFGDQQSQLSLPVDEASETFQVPVPRKPKKVIFNPRNAVLAHVVEE